MTVYDDYLKEEVDVQERITAEIGMEIMIDDPETFKELVEVEQ